MKLEECWRLKQAGGCVRVGLCDTARADALCERLRHDPALIDALEVDVVVDIVAGQVRAWEWPGRHDGEKPPWGAIHAALNEE